MDIEHTNNSKTYQLGNCIQFTSAQEVRIGRIEDYNTDEGWFDCFLYYTPEQTLQGRMSHHGAKELFKTKTWQRFNLNSIIRKIRVLKLPQYRNNPVEDDMYIQRQDYDCETQSFTPLLQKCICGRFVNPDDVLVICDQCEKAYCANCLKINLNGMKFFTCDFCRNAIPEKLIMERYEVLLQHKPELKKQVSRVTQSITVYDDNDDVDEMDLKKRGPKIDLDKLAKKIKKNDSFPAHPEHIRSTDSNKEQLQSKIIDLTLEKQSSIQKQRQMKNISLEQMDRINNLVKAYKLSETVVPNMSKKRLEVRERFLQILFYGIEELRDLNQKDPNLLKKVEQNLISQDDQLVFNYLKKVVLEMEVSLHMKFNNHQRQDRYDPAYINRCKLVYCHLKDDKNLELRRKVITKEFTANDLCTKEERELYNPEKRKETMEMSKLNFELDQKVNVQVGLEQTEEEPEIQNTKLKQTNVNSQSSNALIQTDIYKSLQEYLPVQQFSRMAFRINQELKAENSVELLNQLQKIHSQ